MEPEQKKEARSFNTLESPEQLQLRKEFYGEHKKEITEIIGTQKTERIYRTSNGNFPTGDPLSSNSFFFRNLPSIIGKYFLIHEEDVRIDTLFSYGVPPLKTPQGTEVLMRYLLRSSSKVEQGLFRQRASQKKTNDLTRFILLLNAGKYLQARGELDDLPEEAPLPGDLKGPYCLDTDEKVEEVLRLLEKIDLTTAGVVFKTVIKGTRSFFPSEAVVLLLDNWKFLNDKQKVLLFRFILYFMISHEQREKIEVVLCFLGELSSQKDSPLSLKNLSILFSPLFFIDKHFEVEEDFKDKVLDLTNILEFMFLNSRRVLLIN